MNWPKIHSQNPAMQKLYEKVCWNRFFNNPNFVIGIDREYPLIDTLPNGKYIIHETDSRIKQSAWNVSRYIQNITTRSGWVQPKDHQVDYHLKGNYVAFATWFCGNYGHTMHDFMPYLSWLKNEFPKHNFILHDNSVSKKLIKFVDKDFFKKVFWLPTNQAIEVSGNLIVSTPDFHPCIMKQKLMFHLISWYKEQFIRTSNPKNIIYYDRSTGSNHGRILNNQCQKEIISTIKNFILKNKINAELIIFKGNKENGEPLSIKEQFDIFSNAHTIIGPHGTGLTNILWCNFSGHTPIKLIEFIPGDVNHSAHVQSPFNGYHNVFSGLPIDYNCIIYEKKSTNKETFINIKDLESALDFKKKL
jgi:hypothetical protein